MSRAGFLAGGAAVVLPAVLAPLARAGASEGELAHESFATGRPVASAFPPALDLERATSRLEPHLG